MVFASKVFPVPAGHSNTIPEVVFAPQDLMISSCLIARIIFSISFFAFCCPQTSLRYVFLSSFTKSLLNFSLSSCDNSSVF